MEVNESKIRQQYADLTRLLIRRKLTVTTMESATAGQIASLITDTEGASAIIKGAFVSYSNEAKEKLGVPAAVIREYSVYSVQTAQAMAEACRAFYGADIGIGVTGTMGNADPANPESSEPGKVYFAICREDQTQTYTHTLPWCSSRLAYKLAVAEAVADALRMQLGE